VAWKSGVWIGGQDASMMLLRQDVAVWCGWLAKKKIWREKEGLFVPVSAHAKDLGNDEWLGEDCSSRVMDIMDSCYI